MEAQNGGPERRPRKEAQKGGLGLLWGTVILHPVTRGMCFKLLMVGLCAEGCYEAPLMS